MPLTKPSFFGLHFNDVFTHRDLFTDDLKKSALTANPTPIPEIDLVYVLAARTTVFSEIADIELIAQHKRREDEFDLVDDIHRLTLGIELASQISALRAGKKVGELQEEDYVIPIFYNGRAIHNNALKKALAQPLLQKKEGHAPLPYYPTRLFRIFAIHHPRQKNIGQNTIAQAQAFRYYLNHYTHEHIALVSSAFHLPRAARVFGRDSPQMDETLDQFEFNSSTTSYDKIQFYLFGVHKNEARCGIKHDLIGEQNAMQNYSAGNNPSISRQISTNVFFTDDDLHSTRSLNCALFWLQCVATQEDKVCVKSAITL